MRRQALLKAWAAFGIYWFVTLAVLTFSTAGFTPIVIIAAISLYVGIILAVVSVVSLVYEKMRGPKNKPLEAIKEVKT